MNTSGNPSLKKNPFKVTYPTEIAYLPSKGYGYSKDNPLSSGEIELLYPDTDVEGILSNKSLLKKGTAVDEFLKAIIFNKDIDYNSLLTLDKDAIMIAARILLYGKNYTVEKVKCPVCGEISKEVTLDLTSLSDRDIDVAKLNASNLYEYEFKTNPFKPIIKFSLPTVQMDKKIEKKLDTYRNLQKKLGKSSDLNIELSIRLKEMINELSIIVDSKRISTTKREDINEFKILSLDSQEFNKHLDSFMPGIDKNIPYTCNECGETSDISLMITPRFFWPAV